MNGADRTNSNSVLGHRLDNKTSAPIKSSKKVGSVPATLPPAGTTPVGKPSPFPDGTPGYWATNVNIPLLSRLYDNLSSKWRCGLVDESVLLIAKASVQSGRFSFDKWLVDSTSVSVSSPQKNGWHKQHRVIWKFHYQRSFKTSHRTLHVHNPLRADFLRVIFSVISFLKQLTSATNSSYMEL